MIPKEKVTIYDLAKELNTTASTVSRALKDHPRISKKMKQAVNELAQKLNYQPDPIAHHLRTGKGLVIGVIVPRIDRHFFSSVIGGIQLVAQEYGYSVIISQSGDSYEKEVEAIKAMLNKKVDGLAISIGAHSEDHNHLKQVIERIPVVFFDRIPEDIDTDHVIDDNFKLGYEAVTHLISQGCKKIAHFAGPQSLLEYQERFSGYKKALEDHNIKYEDKYVVYDSITMKTGVDATNYLLNLDDLPDAIFAAGDYSAITAIDTILKAGLKVPQDIAVLGVANEPIVNYLNPSLSSFELFNRQMGEKTAHLLMRRLDKSDEINVLYEGNISETNNVHIVINPELVIRNSSKKVL